MLSDMLLSDIPLKSGIGPMESFQTHNVDYTKVTFRQWCWIIWHYISAFGVMFAILSWLQDAQVIAHPTELKGMKGVYACLIGLALYWLLPHRMVHFHDPIPYSQYTAKVKELQAQTGGSYIAGTMNEAFRGTLACRNPKTKMGPKLWPRREKSGLFPDFFEVHNVPYTYLTFRQWCWIVWHYISAFGVMFAILSWFQDSQVLAPGKEIKGLKGVYAMVTGILLYWLLPHRMYHFHDPQPCTGQVNIDPDDGRVVAGSVKRDDGFSPSAQVQASAGGDRESDFRTAGNGNGNAVDVEMVAVQDDRDRADTYHGHEANM